MLVANGCHWHEMHPSFAAQCNDGEVQLLGGNSSTEGRVEVCKSGVWGTVCDDHWGVEDARVACANLDMPTSCKMA